MHSMSDFLSPATTNSSVKKDEVNQKQACLVNQNIQRLISLLANWAHHY